MNRREALQTCLGLPIVAINPKPADKIVVTCPEGVYMGADQRARLYRRLKEKFPDNEVILLTGGMTLQVIEQ